MKATLLLTTALLTLAATNLQAAKAPLSPEKLEKEASHILKGEVLDITSKKQKSQVEKAFGSHVDEVFTIKLRVTEVSKGTGVKAGDEVEIEAWQPVRRIPALPGLQGHSSIPKKGDTVIVYVKGKSGTAYEPILPNGIAIEAKKKPEARNE